MASFEPCRAKMIQEGLSPPAIAAFESSFNSLLSGNDGIIPESTISPVTNLVHSDSISASFQDGGA